MLLDHEITIDWEGILLSDIRFARLMPLFGILKDVSCKVCSYILNVYTI